MVNWINNMGLSDLPMTCARWLRVAGIWSASALLIVLSMSVSAVEGPAAPTKTDYHIDVTGDMVTLRAHDAPLGDVIRALADRAGFQVTGALPADELVTVSIESQSLQSAIKTLAPRYVARRYGASLDYAFA